MEQSERGNDVRAAVSWNADIKMAQLDSGTGGNMNFLRPVPECFAIVLVAFPVLTETAVLPHAWAAIQPVASGSRETAHVGFDRTLYRQHPEPRRMVEGRGLQGRPAGGPGVCAICDASGLLLTGQPLEKRGASHLPVADFDLLARAD